MSKETTVRVLLVTPDTTSFHGAVSALKAREGIQVTVADSGSTALREAKENAPNLVITDETLPDMTGLALAEALLSVSPFICCAAVSGLTQEDFHEASEGLGVLAQLPPGPGEAEMEALLTQYHTIQGL